MMEILAHPFNDQCFPHIETNQLICRANQLTGFYMMGTLVVKGLIEIYVDNILIFLALKQKKIFFRMTEL